MKWPSGWNDGAFYDLGVFQTVSLNVGERDEPQKVRVCLSDAPFFRVLRVNPELGRLFNDEDTALGAAPVAVISHAFWKSYFGGVRELSVTRLIVAGRGFRVIGVLPPGIDFPARSAIYLPRSDEAIVVVSSSGGQLSPDDVSQGRSAVIGRLRSGVTLSQARERVNALLVHLREINKDTHHGIGQVRIKRIQDVMTGEIRGQVTLLAVAGCFVALVALGSLFLLSWARATELKKNIAIRVALGGGTSALFREEVAWWLWLGLLASAVVLISATFLLRVIGTAKGLLLPRLDELALHAQQAAYIFGGTLAAAILLAFPYLIACQRMDAVAPVLNQSGFQTQLKLKPAVGKIVLLAQLSLALALTATTVRVCAYYWHLKTTPPGIDASGVFVCNVTSVYSQIRESSTTGSGGPKPTDATSHLAGPLPWPTALESQADPTAQQDILDRETFRIARGVTEQPGVLSVATVYPVPYGWEAGSGVYVKRETDSSETFVQTYRVHGDLPKTLGMAVLSGRWFDEEDERQGTNVVVVSALLSRQYVPGQAVGASIRVADEVSPRTIVGVVGDIVAGFGQESKPAIYIPIDPQMGRSNVRYALVARMSAPSAVAPSLVSSTDNILQFDQWSSLAQMVADAGATDYASALTAGWFAGFALLLAAASVYAVVWTLTVQRQREMAIRISLGASPRRLAFNMLADGAALAALAGVGGLFLARGLDRVLWSRIYGFPSFSWSSFTVSVGVILTVTCLSLAMPARSVLQLSPGELLREN
jgi:hypothetical protein